MMDALAAAWAILIGAVVGSFLNVVIARVPAGQSVVRPRSRCPRCGHAITWYDNVPVVSFVLLRGRCRGCRAPIAWRYPLVELLAAGAAYLAWARHGLTPAALAELGFVSLLLALAFIDLDTWLLPFPLTIPLLAGGLLLSPLGLTAVPAPHGLRLTMAGGQLSALAASALAAAIGGAIFWMISVMGARLFRREALGLGDAWLLAGLGAWLGPRALLPVVLLASLQGALIGIALVLLGRGEPGPAAATPNDPVRDEARAADADDWVPPRHAVPFGPFLAVAALEWLYLAPLLARAVPLFEPFL